MTVGVVVDGAGRIAGSSTSSSFWSRVPMHLLRVPSALKPVASRKGCVPWRGAGSSACLVLWVLSVALMPSIARHCGVPWRGRQQTSARFTSKGITWYTSACKDTQLPGKEAKLVINIES